jgi:FtsK/SpoIIIE family
LSYQGFFRKISFLYSGTILSDTNRRGGVMLFEITTSILAGGLVGYSYIQKTGGSNDAIKIQRICANCGLTVKENGQQKTMQLLRRTRYDWGTEYAYRIPLGLSFKDFEAKKDHIQDGLNNKKTILDISLNDLKTLKLSRNIIRDIKVLLEKKKRIRKEIELSYDGVLKIKVYDEPLPELIPFTDEMIKQCKGWEVPIGYSRSEFIKHDFDKIPHMIVAGATNYGKSVFLKNLITTLTIRKSKDVEFVLIDLKGGLAFNRFRFLSQVQTVAKNPSEALDALKDVQEKMEKKMEYLLESGYEDIKEANDPKRYFIIIDEAADISDDKACQEIIKDIARRGRGAGFRLVYATQYPTNETIASQVRQNADARLCFKLQTQVASRAVLDEDGAESLPFIKGRAIYKTDRKRIVQTPYIDNDYIEKTIQPHINIRPRKERVESAEVTKKGTEGRKHTLIIEET